MGRTTTAKVESTKGLQGRRFTKDQKAKALDLLASGMKPSDVAKVIGTSTQSLTRCKKQMGGDQSEVDNAGSEVPVVTAAVHEPAVDKEKQRSPYAPADPANGLSQEEIAGILEVKKEHPSYGPAQLRAQLKRLRGWRISLKAIAKVLKQHGYELVHRGSRPKGLKEPTRFEAPRRNAIWQLDFLQLRVAGEVIHVVLVLDDFSRYIVGHGVGDEPSTKVAVKTLREAMARHGKPEAVRTDRGGAFLAFTKDSDFGKVLEAELIDHIVGHSYHPQGGGKARERGGHGQARAMGCGALCDPTASRASACPVHRRLQPPARAHGHRRADSSGPFHGARGSCARRGRGSEPQASRRAGDCRAGRRHGGGSVRARQWSAAGGVAPDDRRWRDGASVLRGTRATGSHSDLKLRHPKGHGWRNQSANQHASRPP